MNENRRRILQMLAESKITADEAERLLSALETGPAPAAALSGPPGSTPLNRAKYLRVTVDADSRHGGPTKVNIRVPMQLLRAGVRLSALIPADARAEVNAELRRKGVDFDIAQLKPENLEALIEQLGELSVDVEQDRARVRVFAE